MKKIMILIGVVMTFISCEWPWRNGIPGATPFPPGTDWSLDIVKFKNPEYKNHILTRRYPGKYGVDSLEKHVYINDTPCYRLDDPLTMSSDGDVLSLSSVYEKGQWIDLQDGYYLCHWRWQSLFCCRSNNIMSAEAMRFTTSNHYAEYNIRNKKNGVDALFLMQSLWTSLPDTFPYTTHYRYYTKSYFDDDIRWGGWKQDTFKIDTIFDLDFLYSTNEESRIIDKSPLAEHYVVTAKSLYSYTNAKCNMIDKLYFKYHPLDDCQRLTLELPGPFNDKVNYLKYDSLIVRISQRLREVVESGQLQEYVEYDLRYNKVK